MICQLLHIVRKAACLPTVGSRVALTACNGLSRPVYRDVCLFIPQIDEEALFLRFKGCSGPLDSFDFHSSESLSLRQLDLRTAPEPFFYEALPVPLTQPLRADSIAIAADSVTAADSSRTSARGNGTISSGESPTYERSKGPGNPTLCLATYDCCVDSGQLLGRNTVLQELESLELEKRRVKTEAKLQFLCREQWNLNQLQLPVPDEPNIHHIHDFLERSFFIDETVRDKILGLTNMYIDLKNNGATIHASVAVAAKITEDGGGEGDAFLANPKFHFEFRTSTSCCSWCFTISIGNERRSGGTRGTTYWITPVRHEAADAESAPMPLAMPCLVPLPRHGGGSVARHEHRAKGRLSNSSEPPYLIPT
ncbi:hypothetical protein CQW23_04911 [Capsicum baccatum]|uniref:Uncharacterized protein n=1 Tax=Capsicum baccatum TaxID=33114 RepID=A0A2G2XG03_CAPBA|nr:hypothetical protein CQW23_04911 [Capsicum baccatum]